MLALFCSLSAQEMSVFFLIRWSCPCTACLRGTPVAGSLGTDLAASVRAPWGRWLVGSLGHPRPVNPLRRMGLRGSTERPCSRAGVPAASPGHWDPPGTSRSQSNRTWARRGAEFPPLVSPLQVSLRRRQALAPGSEQGQGHHGREGQGWPR